MRLKSIVLSLLLAGAAIAADVNGKWFAQQPGGQGQTREMIYNLKAEGEKLTGTIVGGPAGDLPISDGKISGDNISFVMRAEFNGNTFVLNYKGVVSGDEIKFSLMREGGNQAREFTAKRAK